MQNRQSMFTVLGSKTACFLLTFSLSLSLGGNPAKASVPAPDNDNFSFAFELVSTTGTDQRNTVNATAEPSEPDHVFDPYHSIWYKWTAPSAAPIVFDTLGSEFDTVLAIYTGSSLDSLVKIAANDDFGDSYTSSISLTPTSGTTYYIAVDSCDSGESGTANLNWETLYTLTVIKIGDGTVTSDDHGIDCGEDCSETYSLNTSVTLTATTPSFTGWSGGDCTGKGDCIVNMDTDKTITARFRDKFPWPLFIPKTKK